MFQSSPMIFFIIFITVPYITTAPFHPRGNWSVLIRHNQSCAILLFIPISAVPFHPRRKPITFHFIECYQITLFYLFMWQQSTKDTTEIFLCKLSKKGMTNAQELPSYSKWSRKFLGGWCLSLLSRLNALHTVKQSVYIIF